MFRQLLKKWQSEEKLENLKELKLAYMENTEHRPLIEMLGKLEKVEKYSSQEANETGQRAYEVGPYTVRRTTDGKIATLCVRIIQSQHQTIL